MAQNCLIEQFPTNCLIQIFASLQLSDQFRCGQVCQRWRPLVPVCPKGKTHLEVAKLPFSSNFYTIGDNSDLILSALKSVLPKFGSAVKSICFDDCHISNKQFDLIVRFCPNLKRIDFGIPTEFAKTFNLARFPFQIAQLMNIESIRLSCANLLHNEDFNQFLTDLSQILSILLMKELELHKAEGIDILKICSTAASLTKIRLIECKLADPSPVALLTNLVKLSIDDELSNLHFNQICKNCGNLKILQLKGIGVEPNNFIGLRSLASLEEIQIFSRSLGDSGLHEICKISSLRKLSLSGRNVTDFGLIQLANGSCHQLEEFEIGGNNITDWGVTQMLCKFGRLLILRLSTIRMSNESVAAMADCSTLESVQISTGPSVTSRGFQMLAEKRKNNKIRRKMTIRWTKWPQVDVDEDLCDNLSSANVELNIW